MVYIKFILKSESNTGLQLCVYSNSVGFATNVGFGSQATMLNSIVIRFI